ncbi:MAG TPA: hypothetical protein VK142_09340 [Bacillota bacterium]|nr:hypothetical protein [Bacillota bacterium]
MEKSKKTKLFVLIGFGLIGIAFLFKWQFIYSESIGDRFLGSIGIPIWSNGNMGLHYTFFFALAVLVAGLIILNKQYGKKIMYLSLLIWILIPSDLFANTYQSNFATGIYAMEYQPNESHCDYNLNEAGDLDGSCTFSFVNHSKKPVTFYAAVDLDYDNTGFNFHDMINDKLKTHQLNIEANEQKEFNISLERTLQTSRNQSGGSYRGFEVKITEDGAARKLSGRLQ